MELEGKLTDLTQRLEAAIAPAGLPDREALSLLQQEIDRIEAAFQSEYLHGEGDRDLERLSQVVEIHRLLRLLSADLTMLAASRTPATIATRYAQANTHLTQLLALCQVLFGQS